MEQIQFVYFKQIEAPGWISHNFVTNRKHEPPARSLSEWVQRNSRIHLRARFTGATRKNGDYSVCLRYSVFLSWIFVLEMDYPRISAAFFAQKDLSILLDTLTR